MSWFLSCEPTNEFRNSFFSGTLRWQTAGKAKELIWCLSSWGSWNIYDGTGETATGKPLSPPAKRLLDTICVCTDACVYRHVEANRLTAGQICMYVWMRVCVHVCGGQQDKSVCVQMHVCVYRCVEANLRCHNHSLWFQDTSLGFANSARQASQWSPRDLHVVSMATESHGHTAMPGFLTRHLGIELSTSRSHGRPLPLRQPPSPSLKCSWVTICALQWKCEPKEYYKWT